MESVNEELVEHQGRQSITLLEYIQNTSAKCHKELLGIKDSVSIANFSTGVDFKEEVTNQSDPNLLNPDIADFWQPLDDNKVFKDIKFTRNVAKQFQDIYEVHPQSRCIGKRPKRPQVLWLSKYGHVVKQLARNVPELEQTGETLRKVKCITKIDWTLYSGRTWLIMRRVRRQLLHELRVHNKRSRRGAEYEADKDDASEQIDDIQADMDWFINLGNKSQAALDPFSIEVKLPAVPTDIFYRMLCGDHPWLTDRFEVHYAKKFFNYFSDTQYDGKPFFGFKGSKPFQQLPLILKSNYIEKILLQRITFCQNLKMKLGDKKLVNDSPIT